LLLLPSQSANSALPDYTGWDWLLLLISLKKLHMGTGCLPSASQCISLAGKVSVEYGLVLEEVGGFGQAFLPEQDQGLVSLLPHCVV